MEGITELPRRKLNGAKLREARKAAGYTSMGAFARAIGMTKQRYLVWESSNPPRDTLFTAMVNALRLLNKTYEDITDPVAADPTALPEEL